MSDIWPRSLKARGCLHWPGASKKEMIDRDRDGDGNGGGDGERGRERYSERNKTLLRSN